LLNLHTVFDRLTNFIMIHFTLQMREVKIKLASETVEEYQKKMKNHVILRRVLYIGFLVIQTIILSIRLYVRYKREVDLKKKEIPEEVYLIDIIFRTFYFVHEMTVIYIFFHLFRFFTLRRLDLTSEDGSLTTYHKVILSLVFLAGFFNLEQTIMSIVYSVLTRYTHDDPNYSWV